MKFSVRNVVFLVALLITTFLPVRKDIEASERPKVGLALSGGGAMGLAHIGILHALDSLDIPVDYIAGTSMGGIVGALYATGYSADQIDSLALTVEWSQMFRDQPAQQAMPYYLKQDRKRYQLTIEMQNFRPVTSGLIRGQNIRLLLTELMESFLTVKDFTQLPIPFACTAVDLRSGNAVVLDSGSLPTALRATMSIPSVFTPVVLDSMLLIDGGLLNNLPTNIVQGMGADIIIASAVRNPTSDTEDIRSIIDVVSQSFHIARNSQIDAKAKRANLFLDIKLPGASSADFSPGQVRRITDKGYEAAHRQADSLSVIKQQYQLNRTPYQSVPSDSGYYRIDSVSTHGHLTSLAPEISGKIGGITGHQYDSTYLDSLAIDIFVDEHAFQSLELSLQYDSYYHLVPIAKFDWDNLFLSGIRWESQLSLMGYTRLLSELSYHPQEVMYSVYPFLQVEYRDIPKSVYNGLGQRLTIFQERITDMAFGAGIQFRENIYSRIGFSLQDLRLSPALQLHLPGLTFSPETHYRLHLLQVSGKFDFLDSYVTPNRGFLVEASYALSILGQRSITVVWRHLWIITDRLANATALT